MSLLQQADDIEVDSTIDSDSAYGDELSAYTASITSSIYNFPYKHNRRYHAFREGQYMLPNDEQESLRLDIAHVLMRKSMDDSLYWAPIGTNPLSVIDVGTGNGNWAIEFADEHPSAQVMGNDLSPGPTEVPPNLTFLVDDIEDEWGYERTPFDFVHGRFLTGAIRDWPRLMQQAYSCTRAGGWAEFQDWDSTLHSVDGTLPADSALARWHTMVINTRETQGFSMRPGPCLEEWMKSAGFQNVSAMKILVPLGPWPKDKKLKELGMYNHLQLEAGTEGICLGTMPYLDPPWSESQIQAFIPEIATDMKNRRMHCYHELYVDAWLHYVFG